MALRPLACGLLLSLLVPLSGAFGQVFVGPHAGLNLNGADLFIGGQLRFPVGLQVAETDVLIYPSLETYPFIDKEIGSGALETDYSRWVLNADALLPVRITEDFDSYAGFGLYLARNKWEYEDIAGGDSKTNVGVNLFVGLMFQQENRGLTPFAEARLALGDGASGLIFKGGVLLHIGN